MINFTTTLYEIFIWVFLIYSVAIISVYSWIAVYAYYALKHYQKKNLFTEYDLIVANPNAPSFSLIAPAYNEGMTIVENVRSLLSIYYNNLEIIIVNDGSSDDSILQLIEAYNLEEVSYFVQGNLSTKPIRAVYRSKNPAFKKLLVVDKVNGGKADALNVGINISTSEYIVCIDVDCILEQDCILKLAKPFLEQTDKRVIACGGVIRLANNCEVKNGKITGINLPSTWLGRSQALEYIRAFVLGRMAWSRASGLILISGAFGAFDKEIVLACGGYDTRTVGEDMELVVRMRRYMEEARLPYEVANIPDPLCWTEVPESKEILRNQRNRWMRGTIETLWKHRKMMFNPRYGKLGMISLPYWLIFELLGPIVEYFGYLVFVLFLILGTINWQFFFSLFALVVSSGILYSLYAILIDLTSHQVYTKRKDLSKLVTTAILEPFYFHPIVVKASVNGLVDYFKKKHGWGEMTRQGFVKKQHIPFYQRFGLELVDSIKAYTVPAITFLALYMICIVWEYFWYEHVIDLATKNGIARSLFLNNIDFAFELLLFGYVFFTATRLLSTRKAPVFLTLLFSGLIITSYGLFLYYAESRNLLGPDAFIYDLTEVMHILRTSGMLNVTNVGLIPIATILITLPIYLSTKRIANTPYWGLGLLAIGLAMCFYKPMSQLKFSNEALKTLTTSKLGYFVKSNYSQWYERRMDEMPDWVTQRSAKSYDSKFPFVRPETTPDFLGQHLHTSETPPNLVLIIVEGLGHAYSSPNGYIGNLMPYFDSLSHQSLYWEYTLSSSGRTFAVLPTIMGALPFGESGFLDMTPQPNNFNLLNVLKKNNFETYFYYGGNSDFDNMKSFLVNNSIDHVIDSDSFDASYSRFPNVSGTSWGYDDYALFEKVLQTDTTHRNKPYFKTILTLSMHNPFVINNVEKYEAQLENYLKVIPFTAEQKHLITASKKELISVISFDDALRQFMTAYSQRPEYANTIFVITGDHSMSEIPFQEKINRYHVPLLIYSPLIKAPKVFHHYVSHFDIAPSLLAYYRQNHTLHTPNTIAWIGDGLQASSKNGYPMKESKTQLNDYILSNYHLAEDKLYDLSPKLQENRSLNTTMEERTKEAFRLFKEKNKIFSNRNQLLPDSIYNAYFTN